LDAWRVPLDGWYREYSPWLWK